MSHANVFSRALLMFKRGLDMPASQRYPRSWAPPLAGLVVLIAAYLPTVLSRYAWNDDYQVFEESRIEPITESGLFAKQLGDGRVVGAYLVAGFRLVPDPYTLWSLKVLSLVGLAALFLTLWPHVAPKSHPAQFIVAAGFAATFLLPSWNVFIAYAALWPGPILVALSTYGVLLLKKPSLLRWVLAILLQIPCWSTFPLLSLLPLGVVLVVGFARQQPIIVLIRNAVVTMVLLVVSFIVCLAATVLVQRYFSARPSDRVALLTSDEVQSKAFFFVSRIVTTSFRPFFIDSPTALFAAITAAPLVLVLFIVTIRQAKALKEHSLLRMACVALTILLTASPMLIWNENVIDWRLITVISWTTLAAASVGLWSQLVPKGTGTTVGRQWALVGTSVALIVAGTLSVNHVLRNIYSGPFEDSQAQIRDVLRQCVESGKVESLRVIPASTNTRVERLGDFSLPTDLALPWAAQWAVNAAVVYGPYSTSFDSTAELAPLSARQRGEAVDGCSISIQPIVDSVVRRFGPKSPLE
jgi:hypothetical protein